MSPGVCWITKTGVGPFIDTGVDLSLHVVDRGRMYISVDALREMAQIAGLFDEKEPVSVELKKKEWYDKGYQDASKEINKDAIDNFIQHVSRNAVGAAGVAVLGSPQNNVTAAGAAVSEPAGIDAGKPEDSAGVSRPERKGSSTNSVKRPASVSTNSSDESNFRL